MCYQREISPVCRARKAQRWPTVCPPVRAAEPALPGRRRSAPSGGSDPRSGGAWGLVMVAVLAMHMLVRDFLVGRQAHVGDF